MLLIADGNNLAWAAFHALGRAMGAETPAEKTRAALLGLTQSLLGLAARGSTAPGGARPRLPGFAAEEPAVSAVAVVFDEGRPLRRRSIYPAYQTGREQQSSFIDNEPFVLAAISQFIEGAAKLPIRILRGTNTEADDLAAALTLQSEPSLVRIASTDRDFLQLVDNRVSIYSFVKKVVIDVNNFDDAALPRDKDGAPVVFPRERFLDYRVLTGDSSDDLPGVPGIGSLTAARLLAHAPLDRYISEPGLAAQAMGRASKRTIETLGSPGTHAIIERNRELMDLRRAAAHYPDLAPYTITGTWDEPAFRAWLAEVRPGRVDVDAVALTMASLARRR